MKITASILLASILFLLSSCTENQRAKSFGGTMTVELPKNHKLVNATWKDEEVWYLYRPFRAGETPETHILQEDSKYGLITGKVKFIEK